ncbi:MAG TPA: hypothetical protein VMD27_11405 [Candidatus Aquilonibacter sp.]|nr:hypothetical protein [Candidatus Aquilonibacter sp.]
MGLLDIFRSKNKPQGEILVEFTDEEIEVINKHLESWRSWAAEKGGELALTPKALQAIKAQGLSEYALQLVTKTNDSNLSRGEIAGILDKAAKMQLKAHCLHNLPIFLFYVAYDYELAGNNEMAATWFRNFLTMQNEFKPDKFDEGCLRFLAGASGCDVADAVEYAHGKVGKE